MDTSAVTMVFVHRTMPLIIASTTVNLTSASVILSPTAGYKNIVLNLKITCVTLCGWINSTARHFILYIAQLAVMGARLLTL